jgi:uncharacterized protein YgbK (DUF1537 family)
MLLGCIADDFTGATDLANTLTRQGMNTVVLLGVPDASTAVPDADAVVIALKSRSNPAAEAVGMSLASLAWLQRAAAKQIYFKYCSTFDSTDAGNIGPVAEALMDALGADFTVACPAFPTNKRTIYNGHLFVGDQLLSESGMRHHPLNPMTDALLTRVLQRQCKSRVGLIAFDAVARGAEAIRARIAQLRTEGVRIAVTDAITDQHLIDIGAACSDLKLLTGGSGLALGLPENFRRAGFLASGSEASLPHINGYAAVLAGSCSATTNRQVSIFKEKFNSHAIDPLTWSAGAALHALAWARTRVNAGPILIYSTSSPEQVVRVQSELGREYAGHLIEQTMARIAQGLVEMGVRRLVVAGGETSGAVVSALNVHGLRIGAEIDPGVPWTVSLGADPIALALKSGNFGAENFFEKAFDRLY